MSPEAKASRARMARRIHDAKPYAYHGLLGIDPARCRLCNHS